MPASADDPLIGRTIAGKYRLIEVVGRGAMGTVYRALQVALDKVVAIKVMHAHIAADSSFLERFHREALAASRLDHPNSIQVIDYGADADGTVYLAMEYVEGRDLLVVMTQERPLTDLRIVGLLRQVLAALAVAHDRGVIHRDLKPENILVVKGTSDEGEPTDVVKVCDFGIAKIRELRAEEAEGPSSARGRTTSGIVMGTPEYMSPEQVRGESLDARSDLYSVGVILYELLTGDVPFIAETSLGVVLKHLQVTPALPSTVTQVSPALEAICMMALSKKPEGRPQSARQMRSMLRNAIENGSIEVAPASERRGSSGARPIVNPPTSAPIVPLRGGAIPATAAPPRNLPPGKWIAAAGVVLLAAAIAIFGRKGPQPPPTMTLATVSASPSEPSGVGAAASMAHGGMPLPAPTPTVAQASINGHAPDSTAALGRPVGDSRRPHASDSTEGAGTSTLVAQPSPSEVASTPTSTPPSTTAPIDPVASSVPSVVAVPAPSSAPTAVAPPPVASSEPAVVAVAAPFDSSHARVDIGAVSATNGLNGANVRSALGRAAFSGCYQTALNTKGSAVAGTTRVHMSIDETGRVIGATATPVDGLPTLASCLSRATTSLVVRDVDTGDATADVTLTLVPQ